MKKTSEQIQISHPASGFGIYLPDEVAEHLGGRDSPVIVEHEKLEDGRIKFRIEPAKESHLHIRINTKGTYKLRIFWGTTITPPVPYEFGQEMLNWDYSGKAVEFVFPRKSQLKPPATKTYGGKPKRKHLLLGKD